MISDKLQGLLKGVEEKELKETLREGIIYLMDVYMHTQINDEGNLMPWLMCGVPDGAYIDEYQDFTYDDMWLDCLRIFQRDVTDDEGEDEEE